MLQKCLKILQGLLFPASCFDCGRFISFGEVLPACAECRARLPVNRGPFCRACGRSSPCACRGQGSADRVWFLLHYRGSARKLIHRFKIRRARELGPLFRHLFTDFASGEKLPWSEYDTVVPVPAHREALGGFAWSPSWELAKILSSVSGLPVRRLVRRRRRMRKQSSLSRNERLLNVAGAFEFSGRTQGRSALLIDDVLTTGHTAGECARVLKRHGFSRVDVIACARGTLS